MANSLLLRKVSHAPQEGVELGRVVGDALADPRLAIRALFIFIHPFSVLLRLDLALGPLGFWFDLIDDGFSPVHAVRSRLPSLGVAGDRDGVLRLAVGGQFGA